MLERANIEKLNPLSFLERSVYVYPNKLAVIYKDKTYTYSQLYDRANRLAGALKESGICKGDRVAFLAGLFSESVSGGGEGGPASSTPYQLLNRPAKGYQATQPNI